MEQNISSPKLRWYQSWSGIMIVGLGSAALVFILLVAGTTAYYYWQIRHGHGQVLFNNFYGGFSTDSNIKRNLNAKFTREDLEINAAPFLGSNNPKVTVVEFVDFKCPNCKAEAPILRQVMQKYGNKVKLIIRNFPVESTHPGANQLAVLTMCAYQQGYYWPLHDWLYEQQDALGSQLNDDELSAMTSVFAWDESKMKECLAGTAAKVAVNKDFADAYRFGVAGTPTFFINGEKVEGVIPLDAWDIFLKNVD